jgi:hypothetical protein
MTMDRERYFPRHGLQLLDTTPDPKNYDKYGFPSTTFVCL